MHSVVQAEIDGDATAIYRLVAEVEKWPDLFPHVLGVEVLWRDGDVLVARVRASRSGVPVSWVCRRQNDPTALRIAVEHIKGCADGLRAIWEIVPLPSGRTLARLTVDHHPRGLVDRWLVPVVADDLVTRTLAMVTLLAEADRAAHEDPDVGTARCPRPDG